jgi:hypothetical protein
MGLCASTLTEIEKKELAANAKLDRELQQAATKEQKVVKILLLGTGESGKSTIFKQMQLLYTEGFNDAARANFREVVRKNVVEAMQQLVLGCERFEWTFAPGKEAEAAEFLKSFDLANSDPAFADVSFRVKLLWTSSQAIKTAYDNKSKFYLADSAE